jgi:hypothetical protein
MYVVGGHFSRPVEGMKYPAPLQIVQGMRAKLTLIGTMTKAFLVGARSVWEYAQIQPLYEFIAPLTEDPDSIEEFDTFSWKNVNITFATDGTIVVAPTPSGTRGSGHPPARRK